MYIIEQYKIYVYGDMYIIDEYENGDFHSLEYNVWGKSLEEVRKALKDLIETLF